MIAAIGVLVFAILYISAGCAFNVCLKDDIEKMSKPYRVLSRASLLIAWPVALVGVIVICIAKFLSFVIGEAFEGGFFK